MNTDNMLIFFAQMTAAWGLGWAAGFLFYSFKRGIEKIY